MVFVVLIGGLWLAGCERPHVSSPPPPSSPGASQASPPLSGDGVDSSSFNIVATPFGAELMGGARPEPALPRARGDYGPTLTKMASGEVFNAERLGDVARCGECHEAVVSQWQESAHAFSAFANPFYRVSLDDYVAREGASKARFCNGCHDVGLQFREEQVAPSAEDAHGFAGVTCATCHGVTEASTEGNGSYTLTTAPIPMPSEGDEASLAAHRSRLGGAALRTDALCVSCHRGFMSPETGHAVVITGLDEFGAWRHSGYGGSKATRIDAPVKAQSCTSCHMPEVEGLRSHRFPGGHTTLASALGAPSQLEAIESLLEGAASLDLMPLVSDGSVMRVAARAPEALKAGQVLHMDVVIRNQNVGHHFPGGARDLRDTWVEVVVRDAKGEALSSSGEHHGEGVGEPGVFRLRSVVLDDEGRAVFEHRVADFRAPVFDRTIAPRDAALARYAFTVPSEGLAPERLPLQVTARLRHRRLQADLQRRACEDARTKRGRAFTEATLSHTGYKVDPCHEQPVLDLATAHLVVGASSSESLSNDVARTSSRSDVPRWRRLWERGLALSHHIQERLEEARVNLEDARQALRDDPAAPDWARAAVLSELARVAGRQGRTDDAHKLLLEAARFAPGHPALALIRGDAHAQVWRWEEAAAAYAEAAQLAPRDARAWRGLAMSLGSLDLREASLRAAVRGLALEPRDPHLLRVQSLAWARLAPEDPRAGLAKEAWLAYRRDDEAPSIKGRCEDPTSGNCQRERVPIFVRELD